MGKMVQEETKKKILIVLGGLGFIVAALSGLAEWIPWLNSFCASFSGGCKDTARIALLRLPIWVWGIGIYSLLLLSIFRFPGWLFWLVAAGVGVEVTLVWVMISMREFCIFCFANLLVILFVLIFSFQKSHFWQSLSIGLAFFMASHLIIPYENDLHAYSRSLSEQPDVVAKIGDEAIADEKLGVAVASRVFELEKEIYRIKREQLDQVVAEKLFQREASELKIPLEEYVNKKLTSTPVEVTDKDIEAYYQENLDRWKEWKGTMEELRGRIRTFLEQQKKYEQLLSHAKTLEPKYGVTVYLKAPSMKVPSVDIQGNHSMGPVDAPVTVIEFSDYQCPACRSGHSTILQVRENYKGRIKWVFKDFPLKIHKDAAAAAEAARCAGEQNKFWEYQDILYGTQEEFTPERFEQFAKNLGLNGNDFRQCFQSGRQKSSVEKDVAEAKRIGVDRTPSFIVNGRLTTGVPTPENFNKMIDGELKKVGGKS